MAWASLRRWLGWAPRQSSDLHVTVYTRKACPLCEEVWDLLQAHQADYGFMLGAIDIDQDEELVREYGDWVPVVAINGQVRFRGHVNPVLLKRILDHG